MQSNARIKAGCDFHSFQQTCYICVQALWEEIHRLQQLGGELHSGLTGCRNLVTVVCCLCVDCIMLYRIIAFELDV